MYLRPVATLSKWRRLLDSWDAQQARYRPDRELALRAMSDFVARSYADGTPRVLDLACGCGSVTARLIESVPSAQVLGIDRDPVLLRIAREIWANDPRVAFEQADLRDAGWQKRHAGGQFDAVVTAASLHWFEPDDLAGLYRAIASTLVPGGLFLNLDWIPIAGAPALQRLCEESMRAWQWQVATQRGGSSSPWQEWWALVLADPDLAAEATARSAMGLPRPAEFFADEDWHRSSLIAAGFAEAGVIWRSSSSAIIAARRPDQPGLGSVFDGPTA
ncbi:MAG: class I SAM-dependent methyltransferase [Chloroflexota bacterium]